MKHVCKWNSSSELPWWKERRSELLQLVEKKVWKAKIGVIDKESVVCLQCSFFTKFIIRTEEN